MAGASVKTTGIPVGAGLAFRDLVRTVAPMWRGRFLFRVTGGDVNSLEMAGSEWLVFQRLRRIAAEGGQLDYFEAFGAPLVPRSLAALNAYMRTGAIRKFQSNRWDAGHELIGDPEWRRFCRKLDLKFDGRGTRQDAA